MSGPRLRRAILAAVFLAAVAGFAGVVGWVGLRAALAQLEERGRADLALAADRLQSQLDSYRELSVLLADHPVLVPMVLGGHANPAADRLLTEIADKTGSAWIVAAAANGTILAASDGARGSLAGQPHFTRAISGALGQIRLMNPRRYVWAAPIFFPGGPARGAIAVASDVATIEGNWPADPSPVFFTDETGMVFVSNRTELVMANQDTFPWHRPLWLAGHEIWRSSDRSVPARALHLKQEMPVIGLNAELLLDISPALKLAGWQAAVAAALGLAFGAFLVFAAERRRVLALRLADEARGKALLERRVTERTRELTAAVDRLRQEVIDRQEAEARLKQAQADLIQAGKLSALGQMSAGISHELNQPLMAIQSFAGNAATYLARGNADKAAENLGRIGELAGRMGRIIKNLRAFARAETAQIRAVDLTQVVTAVLELAEARLKAQEVALDWTPPGPVWVRGGEVRLQQVVMNLVSNAIEAMAGRDLRRLSIAIAPGDPVRLTIRDTGPGIAAPDKVFDPFYSTKEVGGSEGMGLGLSISYGLVQSFGGAIRGANPEGGGAEFTVELAPASAEAAA